MSREKVEIERVRCDSCGSEIREPLLTGVEHDTNARYSDVKLLVRVDVWLKGPPVTPADLCGSCLSDVLKSTDLVQ